jgi:hypothetical protein
LPADRSTQNWVIRQHTQPIRLTDHPARGIGVIREMFVKRRRGFVAAVTLGRRPSSRRERA